MPHRAAKNKGKCIVVGGSVIDVVYQAIGTSGSSSGSSHQGSSPVKAKDMPFTSTPCRLVRRSPGGVGRNIAQAIGAIGGFDVTLFTAVGKDALPAQTEPVTVHYRQEVQIIPSLPTATYVALLGGDGDLAAAAADMELLDKLVPDVFLGNAVFVAAVKTADVLILEGNMPQVVIEAITGFAVESNPGLSMYFDPVSPQKALRALSSIDRFTAIKPNEYEVRAMAGALSGQPSQTGEEDVVAEAKANVGKLLELTKCGMVVATLGPHGAVVGARTPNKEEKFVLLSFAAEPIKPEELVKVTGAGDTFLACFITATYATSKRQSATVISRTTEQLLSDCAKWAMKGSALALRTTEPIPVESLRQHYADLVQRLDAKELRGPQSKL